MLRIVTWDTAAHAQHGPHLSCTVLVIEVYTQTIALRNRALGAQNTSSSDQKDSPWALRQGSAQRPLETETFCHAWSPRSGLFAVASSPRALSQEGDGMMAWGQEGESAWQSEPRLL